MDTIPDYLNQYRIYTDGLHDVGVSNLESTTPTVKESSLVRSGKNNRPAPIRENLTTEVLCSYCGKRMTVPAVDYRPGSYAYVCHDCANPFANGRQEKNGTWTEEIERGTLDLQVGTAKPGTETVSNCGTKLRQSAGTECNWCDPNQDRLQFRVSWWTRSLGGKHHWFSVTEHHKANYCPMCGREVKS